MEYVLSERPDLKHFELKTNSFNGLKMKDLSSVNLLAFTIRDIGNLKRYILFGFNQSGFKNINGIDYNKVYWKMFDAEKWNTMMVSYIELASGIKMQPIELASVMIVNKGVKKVKGKFIVEFDEQNGDVYKVLDYSEDFKLVYNERSLGLFLKSDKNEENDFYEASKSSLVQLRRKIIINSHKFLNKQ